LRVEVLDLHARNPLLREHPASGQGEGDRPAVRDHAELLSPSEDPRVGPSPLQGDARHQSVPRLAELGAREGGESLGPSLRAPAGRGTRARSPSPRGHRPGSHTPRSPPGTGDGCGTPSTAFGRSTGEGGGLAATAASGTRPTRTAGTGRRRGG